jgi:hypothetical protein
MYIKSALCIPDSIVINRANSHNGEGNLNEWHGFARCYPNLTFYGKVCSLTDIMQTRNDCQCGDLRGN